MPTTKQGDLPAHPLLEAVIGFYCKGLRRKAALIKVADQFGLIDPETPAIDLPDEKDLETGLRMYYSQEGLVFEAFPKLLHLITHGDMAVHRHQLYAIEDNTIGKVLFSDTVVLYINGKLVDQTQYTEHEQLIVETFQDTFSGLRPEDLERLSYNERIEVVMSAYHVLHPRDSIDSVLLEARAACPVGFPTPQRTPEFIGRAYVRYLQQCDEEGREGRYIKGLSSFIRNRDFLNYGEEEGCVINLYNQPSHQKASEIFRAITLYGEEKSKNNAGVPGGKDTPEKGRGHKRSPPAPERRRHKKSDEGGR